MSERTEVGGRGAGTRGEGSPGEGTPREGSSGGGSYRAGPAGLAYQALLDHTQMCEQCVDNVQECATGRALVRTLREAARGRR